MIKPITIFTTTHGFFEPSQNTSQDIVTAFTLDMSWFWFFIQKHTSTTLTEKPLRWGPCLYYIPGVCNVVITMLYVLPLFIQSPQQTPGNHNNYRLTPWCFRKLNLNLTIVREHLAPYLTEKGYPRNFQGSICSVSVTSYQKPSFYAAKPRTPSSFW